MDPRDVQLLQNAWRAIEQDHLEMARQKSIETQGCITIFKFIKTDDSHANVELYLADYESENWKMLLSDSPDSSTIKNIFNRDEHFMICVSIPTTSNPSKTISSIHIFDLGTFTKVC